MNENDMDITTDISTGDLADTELVESDTEYSTDNMESDILDSGSDVSASSSDAVEGVTNITYAMEYDEELGGYPVVIVNDMTENYDVSLLSLPDGASGYQISDYWMNYFRGVLQKYDDVDYLAFATRENATSNYNYVNHYWLYVGDLENGGDITVYDCYAENSIYYVDVSTENMGAINVDNYTTLAYSNLGHLSDFRNGGGYVGETALLFFFGFFAVYVVCRDFFNCVLRKLHRK